MNSKTITSLNPATGEVLEEIPVTPEGEINQGVDGGVKAQSDWSEKPVVERVEILEQFADNLEKASRKMAKLMTEEQGKPISEATGEVDLAVYRVRYFCERAEADLEPDVIPLDDTTGVVHHRPYGVVGAITPWNYPVSIPIWTIVPALLAGNSVVFKPSELTPLLGRKLYELFPEEIRHTGCLSLIQGAGEQGQQIVNHEKIRALTFVGSYETGTGVMADSARHVREVGLELGGKDPVIILPDADIDRAVDLAMAGGFKNCGQVCCGFERALIHTDMVEGFTEKLVEKIEKLTIGPGLDDPDMGPMVRDEERQRVNRHLEDARKNDGIVHTGGPIPKTDGFWVTPAVVENATREMEVMNAETFGPVLPVWTYNETTEAIEEANRLEYGLGAGLIGSDSNQLKQLAQQIEAGNIGINQAVGSVVEFPWGGVKHSGIGRMLGPRGILRFTEDVTHRWNSGERPSSD